jgi:hypothetical protein
MAEEAYMNRTTRALLFWTPRILGILFVVFISLFSLDVFEMGARFWGTLGGLIIHNIPTLILIAALVIGWRWEWAAAVGFFAFALWLLIINFHGDWLVGLVFAGVPLLVGALFLLGWIWRKKIRPSSKE